MNNKWVFNFLNDIGVSNLLRNRKKNKLTVLSLHRVSTESDYFWDPIKPQTFELLLRYLQKYYNIICFADIESINKPSSSDKPYLILSFDDGYYDFYEFALPLLVKYNIPCNHNIVNECAENNMIIWTQRMNFIFTHCRENNIELNLSSAETSLKLPDFNGNWMEFYLHTYKWMRRQDTITRMTIIEKKEKELSIAGTARMMNWAQVAECAANKVEIGSHTYSHGILSAIKDREILKKEIVVSANELRNKLNKDIDVLALPNSAANEDIHQYAAEAGLRYILYVENNINAWRNMKGSGIKNVDRINLVEEPISSMILRAESLHAKLKQYV